ncbi:hypothetical protein [Agarivorans gilvus]|jgi:hypothetical protein|uniref:Uncharacterized protein n=1 Tax=Agarivorans gilvus TaxID=680279 RepID=A0ABQ1HVT1_9ALTE|nr:hypothetical protein [Agarivorans gilvus]GGA93488.1 hypothetical protein GCM10007414_02740 [Agarivorans gilvus]
MRYKAKISAAITQALPLVQSATADEAVLWNIEKERDMLCMEFTSNLSFERLEAGFQEAAEKLGISCPISILKLRR